MISPHNILRHELIGLNAKVVRSWNPLNLGLHGKITDETHHTLVLTFNRKDKRIFKRAVTLEINLPNKTRIEVDGATLEGRPWDRIKKNK